jgi:hypothetical protein
LCYVTRPQLQFVAVLLVTLQPYLVFLRLRRVQSACAMTVMYVGDCHQVSDVDH